VNAYLVAATALIAAIAPCLVVCVRGSLMEAIAALELCGTLTTLALICLAEGFHRQAYFGVALICSVLVWISGLVFVRFLSRLK
jgi:multisubunit Na+/H+ antiporter MnhF subunit